MKPKLPEGPVTNALVIANLFIALILLVPSWWQYAVVAGGLFPARFGAGDSAFASAAFVLPAWLTPLSSAFLHGDMMHAIWNMLMLALIGRFVERALGWQLYLLLYVIGAYAAALAEWIAHPASMNPVVGASGALSAVIAAYAMLYASKPGKSIGRIPAQLSNPLHLLAAWIGINLLLGFTAPANAPIAIWAHIGGFVAGLLLARPLLLWRFRKA